MGQSFALNRGGIRGRRVSSSKAADSSRNQSTMPPQLDLEPLDVGPEDVTLGTSALMSRAD